MKRKYIVIDLETTGNSPKTGERIIQLAAVVIQYGKVIKTYSTYLNPEKEIPPFITNLTGIKNDDVKAAPLFIEIIQELNVLFEDCIFVAHNIHFDYVFLQDEYERIGYTFPAMLTIDTVELARILYPTLDSYKLNDLAGQFDLYHDRPHQADSDAFVTATLFLTMIEGLKKLPLQTLQGLLKLSAYYKSDLSILLSSIHREKLIYNWEDEGNYAEILNLAVRSDGFNIPDEVEKMSTKTVFERVVRKCGLRTRPEQEMMVGVVEESLQGNKLALIEAGTGIGKTLAYLIPSITYAINNEEQVLISTQSLQLQNQLLQDTIPQVEYALNKKINIALLKGRKHYLSLQKFSTALNREESNYDVVLTKSQLLVWLTKTNTGDVDEINLPSGGLVFWEEVCSGFKEQAHSFQEFDFYSRAVHRAMLADLIVTNHALLLHDLQREEALFSEIKTLIVDEAHRLVDTATSILGNSFSASYCNHLIMKSLSLLEVSKRENHFKWRNNLKELKLELDDVLRFIFSISLKSKSKSTNVSKRKNLEFEKLGTNRDKIALQDMIERLIEVYKIVSNEDYLHYDSSIQAVKLSELQNRMNEQFDILQQFLYSCQNHVKWLEFDEKGTFHSLAFYIRPIDVSHVLKEKLFSRIERGILTSATLSVNSDFQYLKRSLGIEGRETKEVVIGSPFEYEKYVEMYVPTDLPSLKAVEEEEYLQGLCNGIEQILQNSIGKTLILVQSNDLLSKIYEQLKVKGSLSDTVLLSQSAINNRSRIVKQFKQFNRSALLGGMSFWEGIDFESTDVTTLVIVRLPFSSPDHPFVKRKIESIREQGGSPFYEYSLPQAIIRFKQGFGRLIRSEESSGVIFILDNRLIEASYGSAFISSIPSVKIKAEPLNKCIKNMKKFMNEK